MLDIAVAYDRYRFLGCEFLTWLWYLSENEPRRLSGTTDEPMGFEPGNKIVFENRSTGGVETISITGDDAGLEEGCLALKKGARVLEMNLVIRTSELKWKMTVKGENLGLTGFTTPDTAPVETDEDADGALLEKLYLMEAATGYLNALFADFLKARLADDWDRTHLAKMKQWIENRDKSDRA